MIHHYFQQLNGKEVLFVVGLFSYLFIFLSICDKVRANTCLSFDKRTCQHFLKFYKFTYHELSPENIKAKKKFTNFIVNIVFRDNVWQSYVTWQRRIISGNLIFSDAAKETSFFFHYLAIDLAWSFVKKIDTAKGLFLWILKNFSKQLFWRTQVNDCFFRMV